MSTIDLSSLAARVASRHLAAAESFETALKDALKLKGRRINFSKPSDTVYINFINLPTDKGQGGAESENNRMSFSVSGFSKDGTVADDAKLKVEQRVSALPREYKLRAKSGTQDQIVKYLAAFINKVVEEVEPKFTHTKV